MNKKVSFFLTALLIQCSLFAHEIKPRIGMFFPVDTRFQDIYGPIGPTYEIELTGEFFSVVSIWGNFNVSTLNGSSLDSDDHTEILIANYSFGPKIKGDFGLAQVYAGIGCVLSGIFIENQNTACCNKTSKFSVGGVVKLGVQRYITERLFLDFFLDYYYQPVEFATDRDVGGLRSGLGLGYGF